jgi:hypothetical protein
VAGVDPTATGVVLWTRLVPRLFEPGGGMPDTRVRLPLPREGDARLDGTGRDEQLDLHNQVPARLTAGPDGALWVTVDGADVQQLAARIDAVCDVLIRAQRTPPRTWTEGFSVVFSW